MTRTAITRQDPAGELKGLRQRVAELEALINEQKHVDIEPAQHKISEIRLINSINDAVNRGSSLKEVIQLVATETQKLFGGNAATISLLSEDKQYLVMQNFNLPPRIMRLIENLIGTKILTVNIPLKADSIYSEILKAGKAQLTNDPVVVQRMADECTEDEVSRKLIPMILRFLGVRSVVSIPLVSDGNGIGLMDISRSKPFTESEIERLQTVAGQLVGVIRRKQVEEALKNSEEHFRRLSENAPRDLTIQKQYQYLLETIVVHVPVSMAIVQDRKFVFVNQQFCQTLGYTEAEILAMDVMYGVHPEDRASVRSNVIQMLKGERTEPFEFRVVNKDGDIRWVIQSVASITYNGQRASLASYLDFTEQRKAELALQESEQNLKEAQSLGKIGNWEFDFATKQIKWSDETYRLYERDKALGPPSPEEEERYYLPEQNRKLRKYALLAVETGKEYHYDLVANLPSGKTMLLGASMRPIKDERGQVIRLFGTVQDITEHKQAEQALVESHTRFKELAELLPLSVFEVDDKGNFTYFNKEAMRCWNMTPEAAPEENMLDVFIPEDRDRIITNTARVLMGEDVSASEYTALRQDGTTFPVLIYGAPIVCENKVVGIRSVSVDITERKKAEQSIKESEENFRNSIDNSPMGIMVFKPDGDIIYANRALLDTYGLSSIEELRNTPVKERYTPEAYAEYQVRFTEFLNGKTEAMDYEIGIVRKDGTVRQLQAFRREVTWGGEKQYQLLYFDITERKKVEEALKNSEERFRRLADNARDIVFRFRQSPSLGFDYISPAVLRISGYTQEEFYADPRLLFNVIHPDSRSFLEEITSHPQDYLDKPVVLHWVHKNGESIWTEQRSVPIYDDDGKIVAVEGIQRDMTERKHIEENLRESEANLRAYLDNAPDGVCIYDLQGTFLYGNKRAEEIMGYRKEELIGKSFLSLEILPTKYLAKAGELLTLNAGGKSTGPDEFELTTKDGNHSWVEISTTPIKQSDKVLILSFIRDINDRKRADVALRISEENYRNSVANSPMGIIVFKREGDIIYANQTLLDMYGFSDIEELRNTPVKERYTPEAYAEYLVRHEEFLNGKKGPMDYEISIRPKDGAVRQLQAFRREIVWGEEEQFQLLYIDITERKKAEEAMRESRARFRELSMLLPQSVWETDENGMVTYTNEATMRLFGYTRQDTAPLHYLQNMIPEDRDRAAENTQRLLQGENLGGIEYTGLRKDGSTFPEMIYASAIIRNGKRVGLRGITVDITEQKKSEKRLEQAAQEWRTTFDSIIDSISIHDKDNRIIRVNKAEANMLKTTPKEIIGKFCHELVHNTAEPPENCPHRQTLKTGNPASIESYNPELGIYLYESTSPIFDDKGEVVGTVHIVRDVTKQKQMEQQLMLTDRLASVGELASGVAHELNNPLTSVIGFSQLLMEGEIPAAIKEDLGLINSEAQRAANIVKNLLTFARKHTAVKQPTRINKPIEDVLKLRAYEQKVNNIEVVKNLASDIPEMMLDYFQIQQVFLNIIINAEFFMTEAHRRGLLTITTEKIGRMVRVSFVDDGPGIPQENLNRIFDPFFTTKEVGKGTGLGLSICHGIITEHSGTIHAESPGGKGAAFIIELPLSDLDV